VNKLTKIYIFLRHAKFLFLHFLFFYFLFFIFFIFLGLGPAQPMGAGLDPAGPARRLLPASVRELLTHAGNS